MNWRVFVAEFNISIAKQYQFISSTGLQTAVAVHSWLFGSFAILKIACDKKKKKPREDLVTEPNMWELWG